jgi:hypothetical protein
VTFTQVAAPPPGQPLPAGLTVDIVGPPPGGQFSYLAGAVHTFVSWNGSGWEWEYHDAFYGEPSVPLIWDPVSLTYKATFLGPRAYLYHWWRCDVEWDPSCDMTAEWLRTDLDIRQGNPAGDIWRMEDALVRLSDNGPVAVTDPPPVWSADHTRGLCYPVGSQSGGRVAGQRTRFLAP